MFTFVFCSTANLFDVMTSLMTSKFELLKKIRTTFCKATNKNVPVYVHLFVLFHCQSLWCHDLADDVKIRVAQENKNNFL